MAQTGRLTNRDGIFQVCAPLVGWAVRRGANVEIALEEAPVGDHQANGVAENAVKNSQGQFRAIEERIGE